MTRTRIKGPARQPRKHLAARRSGHHYRVDWGSPRANAWQRWRRAVQRWWWWTTR